MRVWHFNGVITTYGKRNCRNSWRYASLAVNRGAIKQGFTVYQIIVVDMSFTKEVKTGNCKILIITYIIYSL